MSLTGVTSSSTALWLEAITKEAEMENLYGRI